MARTKNRNRDVILSASFFVLALVMLVVAATEARASGAAGGCSAAPHELLMRDTELCRKAQVSTGGASGAEQKTSPESNLEWFLAAIVVGLAALAAFAIESPASRPFVPPTTEAIRP
jgi:hypothetical protein